MGEGKREGVDAGMATAPVTTCCKVEGEEGGTRGKDRADHLKINGRWRRVPWGGGRRGRGEHTRQWIEGWQRVVEAGGVGARRLRWVRGVRASGSAVSVCKCRGESLAEPVAKGV